MRFDPAFEALVEFAASRHNAFHTLEAADHLVPAHRLRRAAHADLLVRLHPRVWAFRALGRPPGQALRAATVVARSAAACHLGSAWVHGWIDEPPSQPSIWVPGSARPPVGVTLLRAQYVDPAHDVCILDGIRTLNRAATLCLLGRVVSRQDLGWYLDQFIRSDSIEWLYRTLGRLWSPTDAGPVALAALLADRDRLSAGTESWLERVVADLLTVADLPPLKTQFPLEVDGRRFRLDLAMPSIKLGVEAHGRTFHWGPDRADADNVRDLLVGSQGWQLLYVTRSQLVDPAGFVDLVVRVARARRAQLGSSAA